MNLKHEQYLSEDKLLMASTWFSSKQSMEKQQLLCLLESKLELITERFTTACRHNYKCMFCLVNFE
jgi:hypothetical protein